MLQENESLKGKLEEVKAGNEKQLLVMSGQIQLLMEMFMMKTNGSVMDIRGYGTPELAMNGQ